MMERERRRWGEEEKEREGERREERGREEKRGREREGSSLSVSSYKDTNAIMRTGSTLMNSSKPNYLPRTLPSNIITLEVRA